MTLILAGSKAEYDYLCRRKGLKDRKDALYVASFQDMRGQDAKELWTYGTFYTRSDFSTIQSLAASRGIKIRNVW